MNICKENSTFFWLFDVSLILTCECDKDEEWEMDRVKDKR